MRLNPYIAGNPVRQPSSFFGREEILNELQQVLNHPQHNAIVLFGQRRVGKTSILLQLQAQLAQTGRFVPVYYDLQDKASQPLGIVLLDLARTIAAGLGQPAPNPSEFDAGGDFFRKTFIPNATRAASAVLVLLFDEFDVLDSPESNQAARLFFPYLRSLMEHAQSVKFVFVIGRRPEELSTETISTFKGIRAARVSTLARNIAESLVRQSEQKGGMLWSDAAVEKVWEWTEGHAYFTQLLCSIVWEKVREERGSSAEPPRAEVMDVENAIDDALKQGANAFHWLWDGLPPAERVIVAAIAEAPSGTISQDGIEEILNRSGVRLVVRELKLAPETLVEWQLLRPDNGGYSFSVPLLRRWVRSFRPLRRVKDELDRLDPLAEGLFRTGQSFYNIGQYKDAESQLGSALQINPNHLKSRLLLGRLLLETNRIKPSVEILEQAYMYDPPAALPDLIRSLLASANSQEEGEALSTLDHILQLQPNQPQAKERREAILKLEAEREIPLKLALAQQAEATGDWPHAIVIYDELLGKFPHENARIAPMLQRANDQSQLMTWYNQALGALATGNLATAGPLLAQVIAKDPGYQDAARYLLSAVRNIDVAALQSDLAAANSRAAENERLIGEWKTKHAWVTKQLEMARAKPRWTENKTRLLFSVVVGLLILNIPTLIVALLGNVMFLPGSMFPWTANVTVISWIFLALAMLWQPLGLALVYRLMFVINHT